MEELSFTDEEIEELSKLLYNYQSIKDIALGVDIISLLGEVSNEEIISRIVEKIIK